MKWTEALFALKEATKQLKALEGEGRENKMTEAAIADDPAAFFTKVRHACGWLVWKT